MLLLTLAHSFFKKAAKLKILMFNSGRLQISRYICLVGTSGSTEHLARDARRATLM